MFKKRLCMFMALCVALVGFTVSAYALEDIAIYKSQIGDDITITGDALPDTWVNLKITDANKDVVYFSGVRTLAESPEYNFTFKIPSEAVFPLDATLCWGDNVETAAISIKRSGGGGGGGGGSVTPDPDEPTDPEQPADPELPGNIGKDIPANHWAKGAISNLVENGIIKGDAGSGNIRPNNKVSREEIAAMLVRAMDIPVEDNGEIKTGDDSSPWAKDILKAAVEAGIIKGDGNGNMSGQRHSSRLEVSVMIARAKGLQSDNLAVLDSFADSANIPDWAKESIAGLIEADIIKGYGDKTLRLNNQITRAEAFAMLDRILE